MCLQENDCSCGAMQVLVDDDLYLDIDPSKAVVRFPAEERLRHFGSRDSADYARRLGAYRSWTLERLARLAQVSGSCLFPLFLWSLHYGKGRWGLGFRTRGLCLP